MKPKPPIYPRQSLRLPICGWIYCCGFRKAGIYKLGFSRMATPGRRLANLKNLFKRLGLREKIDYSRAFWSDDVIHDERSLHLTYASKRIDGEWFQLTPQDLLDFEQAWGASSGQSWSEPRKEYKPDFSPRKSSVSVSRPDPLERRLEAANRTAISKLNKRRRVI